jgi:putative ATP-dependent endonuclease of the OLD family
MGGGTQLSRPAIIHQIKIERFRGIENLKWNPVAGINVILGGGDVGKTTILDAIALLLSPSNSFVLSEADYWNRDYGAEFSIRAVMSLPASSDIGQHPKFAWPWEWNGTDAVSPVVPDGDDDLPPPSKPVYCIQVRGTSDLEVVWEIIQPNGDADPLAAAVRRAIGVVRLASDERNDRDLRLVYGSALDRLLADKGLRARIGQELAEIDLQEKLSDDAKKALVALDKALKKESLPSTLQLGLTSSQGISIGALVGLLAERTAEVSLPLARWGAGTRRMATLKIAAAIEAASRITVIDEIERGLEPYRVRKLVRSLQDESTQTFVTTHSPVVIASADKAALWYLDRAGRIGALPRDKIERQQQRDPETFLCRLAVIAEGSTEVGFVSYLLERAVDGGLLDHGLRVCDGQGNSSTLDLLETLAKAHLKFTGFADNEGANSGRWTALKAAMGDRLFQWISDPTDANVIRQIPEQQLDTLITGVDADVSAERRLTLATRLGIEDRSLEAIKAGATAQSFSLRDLIIAAATGSNDGAPDADAEKTWKKHGARWFKSLEGGRKLAEQMFVRGAWPALRPALLPFVNAVRAELGQAALQDVAHE